MEKKKIIQLVEKNKDLENKKESIKITQDDIIKKTTELCDMIKAYEGSKACAANYICFEVVVWAADNHYEGLGILAELLARYRETSLEAMEED